MEGRKEGVNETGDGTPLINEPGTTSSFSCRGRDNFFLDLWRRRLEICFSRRCTSKYAYKFAT